MPSFGGNPRPAAPAPRPARAPAAGDAGSGGYNFGRAHAYTASPAYHAIVRHVIAAQPRSAPGDAGSGGYNFGRANAYKNAPVSSNTQGYGGALRAARIAAAQAGASRDANRALSALTHGTMTEHAIDTSGAGGLHIGAINLAALNPIPALGDLAHLGGNLGSDAINMIPNMGKGAIQLGLGAFDDLTHGRLSQLNGIPSHDGQQSHVAQMLGSMVNSDALAQAAQGHFGTALKLAGDHPLNAILDFTGAGGLAGRLAGAAGRTGALGASLKDAASLAPVARELVPGVGGTTVLKTPSSNLFRAAVDRYAQSHPAVSRANPLNLTAGRRIDLSSTSRAMKQQAALQYGSDAAAAQRLFQNTAKDIKASKPSGKVEANVAQYPAAFGGGRATLQHFHDQYANVANSDAAVTTTPAHLKNLKAALAKTHLDQPSIDSAAAAYATRQAALEGLKSRYGLRTVDEMHNALLKQYALEQMPGAYHLDEAIPHPQQAVEVKVAQEHLSDAQAAHQAEVDAANRTKGYFQGHSAMLADATKRLPVGPTTDAMLNHLLDQRALHESQHAQTMAAHEARIAASADTLHDAQQTLALIKKYPKTMQGLIVEDPAERAMASGPYKGLQARPLTADEVKAHMTANGHEPAYMNMRLAEPQRAQPISMQELTQPARQATGRSNAHYSGLSAHTGGQVPGWSGLANSQLTDAATIGYAMKRQNFLDRFSLKTDPRTGEPLDASNLTEAQRIFEAQTGIPTVAVNDARGAPVLLPKPYADEYAAQTKVDSPSPATRLAMKSNRAFTSGTLAMSPKLPVMHTVENVAKSTLASVTPLDLAFAHRVTSKMDPEALARLKQLATPGTMAHSVSKLGGEDLGKMVSAGGKADAVKKIAGTPGRALGKANSTVIRGQRITEVPAQQAVLGQFLRRTASSMGLSTEQMATLMEDPKWQEAAASHVQDALGKWNNYTAGARRVTRVAPFSPWTGNALKFAAKTMPGKHPLPTAGLLDTAAANKKGWDAAHAYLPADARLSVLLGPGHELDAGKFLPMPVNFGGRNVPEALGSIAKDSAGFIAPQAASVIQGLTGNDGFWNPIYDAHGQRVAPFSPRAMLHALEAGIGAHVPAAEAAARILQDDGGTLTADSLPLFGQVKVKPGSQHAGKGVVGGLAKQFNPFRGTYFRGGGSGASSGGTGGIIVAPGGAGGIIVAPGGNGSGAAGPSKKSGLFSGKK